MRSEGRRECFVCDVLGSSDCYTCDMEYSRMRDYEETKMIKCDLCSTLSCCGSDFMLVPTGGLTQ